MRNFKLFLLALTLVALPAFTFAKSAQGSEMSEQHRSQVASTTKKLIEFAGKDRNIGQEIKAVAQAQQQVASTTAALIEKVESRSKFKIFLIGSDYKNLGALRSELVTTANHIRRLENVVASSTTASTTALLQEQIDSLRQTNSAAQDFVKENESKFSLFGWLVKLFN